MPTPNDGEKPDDKVVDRQPVADRMTLLDRLTQRHGTLSAAADVLADENFQLREKNRQLRETNEKLVVSAPKDGGIVLTKEQAEAFKAFTELKLEPKAIADALKKKEELEATVAEHQAKTLFEEAGTAAGLKPALLQKLSKTEAFTIEMRDVSAKGEDDKIVVTKVPHAKKADGTIKTLAEFAQVDLADYYPALVVEAAQENDKGDAGKASVTVLSQGPATKKVEKKDATQAFLSATFVPPSKRNAKS